MSSLERSRSAVAEDLATVSAKYEKVSEEVQQIPQLKLRLEASERFWAVKDVEEGLWGCRVISLYVQPHFH